MFTKKIKFPAFFVYNAMKRKVKIELTRQDYLAIERFIEFAKNYYSGDVYIASVPSSWVGDCLKDGILPKAFLENIRNSYKEPDFEKDYFSMNLMPFYIISRIYSYSFPIYSAYRVWKNLSTSTRKNLKELPLSLKSKDEVYIYTRLSNELKKGKKIKDISPEVIIQEIFKYYILNEGNTEENQEIQKKILRIKIEKIKKKLYYNLFYKKKKSRKKE